jgi:hypothetical protein
MSNKSITVITVYGHDEIIDKISFNSFDISEKKVDDLQITDAEVYCNHVNSLELTGNSWVFAKEISENRQYRLDSFLPLKFDVIVKLNDGAIQKVMREVDSQDLVKALKGQKKVQEFVYRNMSKRATEMLKEDYDYMGPVSESEVKEAQENILNIIRKLEKSGEIIIPEGGFLT